MSVRILDKITSLFGKELRFDLQNTSRYALFASKREENGVVHAAYFFNAPIYNKSTHKLLKGGFTPLDGGRFVYKGSNSEVTVINAGEESACSFEHMAEAKPGYDLFYKTIAKLNCDTACNGRCGMAPCLIKGKGVLMRFAFCDKDKKAAFGMTVSLGEDRVRLCDDGDLIAEGLVVSPSLNGVRIRMKNNTNGVTLMVHTDEPFISTRNNTKCFVLMEGQFRPYATINAIGNADRTGSISAPAVVSSEKIADSLYKVNISSNGKGYGDIVFEISLYEEKLFQDTTVESALPLENNAFGAVGFIGESREHGVQWLYSRVDVSRLEPIMGKRLLSARLYVPALSQTMLPLEAYRISKRFCSFGSNWEGKVPVTSKAVDAEISGNYYIFDLTEIITDKNKRLIRALDGLVIRTRERESGFTAIATGDCNMPCQLLEIRYR